MSESLTCPVCGQAAPPGSVECPRDQTPLSGEAYEPTVQRDALVGALLGEYRLVRRVGAGSAGLVYEATHGGSGRRVAIKVLRPDYADDPDLVRRFLAEAQAAGAVRHPCIVETHGLGTLEDGRPYLVMELLAGRPLEDLLVRGRLPLEDSLAIVSLVLSGLEAAHKAGVVHRDVKPSNIFVMQRPDGSRYVKLLDFGLAKRGGPLGAAHARRGTAMVGTPDYLPPEQWRGQALPVGDLYSVGVIAFRLVTGRLPFEGRGVLDVMRAHMEEPPPRPSALASRVPRALEEWILSLLEKDPSRRPRTAGHARERLEQIRADLRMAATWVMSGPPPEVLAAQPEVRLNTPVRGVQALAPRPSTSVLPPPAFVGTEVIEQTDRLRQAFTEERTLADVPVSAEKPGPPVPDLPAPEPFPDAPTSVVEDFEPPTLSAVPAVSPVPTLGPETRTEISLHDVRVRSGAGWGSWFLVAMGVAAAVFLALAVLWGLNGKPRAEQAKPKGASGRLEAKAVGPP